MAESHAPERLLLFTDAVVAIAITLLVLPLVDSVHEGVVAQEGPAAVVLGNLPGIYGFLLSFVVIARMWAVHHQLFRSVTSVRGSIMLVDFVWLLAIVLLPYPTALVSAFPATSVAAPIYIAVLFVASAAQAVLAALLRRNTDLLENPADVTPRFLFGSVGSAVAVLVALVLTILVPRVTFFGLFLLFVPPLLGRLLKIDDDRTRPARPQPAD